MSNFDTALKKLESLDTKYQELSKLMSDVSVINDHNRFVEVSKEISYLEPIIEHYNKYKNYQKELLEAQDLADNETDSDMKDLAESEIEDLSSKITNLEIELKHLLIPPDPLASRNIIVEIRAGTGGDEAALFAAELFKMYSKFSERKRWKIEILNSNDTQLGGYKEIIFSITGKNVYENLRFEYGGHRVQRVPTTESGGRVHTSAVTVAVLPEATDTEIKIKTEDLRIDVMRAGGAGGQHVNKTESAVRITHLPTNIVVQCQDSPSQHMNKASAMKVLKSRLYELEQKKKEEERSKMRKNQVGSGDRSDKIRTYNYPQNRVTDHRINMTLYKLDLFLQGDMDEIIEALKINFAEEQLKIEGL